MAGVDIIHVPYKGAGAAYGDLISGTVQMMFANIPSMLPQVRGGKVRGLAVTSAERSKAAPDIPTIAETLPGYVATSWYGVGAPAGTPEPILAKLEAAIAEALAAARDPEALDRRSRPRHAAAGTRGLRRVPRRRPQALGAGREGVRREARLARAHDRCRHAAKRVFQNFRVNENRSASASPLPQIWARRIWAAIIEKVMPLPP